MRYREIIAERVRPNQLYHAVAIDLIYEIVTSDTLQAKTSHRVNVIGGDTAIGMRKADLKGPWHKVNGVSLTRDIRFARKWRPGGAILVLDGDLLRHRHRLLGANYYQDRAESEEFVIGPIKNLSTYLTEIQVSGETYEWCKYEEAWQAICDLPKLTVAGYAWDSNTGMIKAKQTTPAYLDMGDPKPWQSGMDY